MGLASVLLPPQTRGILLVAPFGWNPGFAQDDSHHGTSKVELVRASVPSFVAGERDREGSRGISLETSRDSAHQPPGQKASPVTPTTWVWLLTESFFQFPPILPKASMALDFPSDTISPSPA